MIYKCNDCGLKTDRKCNYDQHMNKKIPCNEEKKEQYYMNLRTCEKCKKIYSCVITANRHRKICKHNVPIEIKEEQTDELEDERDDEIKKLKKNFEDAKKKLESAKKKRMQKKSILNNTTNNNINNITNNNTNNNNTTNINIQVNNNIQVAIQPPNIVNFGEEDLSKIDVYELMYIVSRGCCAHEQTLQSIHFNEKYPQYQNIIFIDKTRGIMTIRQNDIWIHRSPSEVYPDVLEHVANVKDDLVTLIKEQLEMNIDDKEFKYFNKYVDNMDDREKLAENKQFKKDILNCLHDNRNATNFMKEKAKKKAKAECLEIPKKLHQNIEAHVDKFLSNGGDKTKVHKLKNYVNKNKEQVIQPNI